MAFLNSKRHFYLAVFDDVQSTAPTLPTSPTSPGDYTYCSGKSGIATWDVSETTENVPVEGFYPGQRDRDNSGVDDYTVSAEMQRGKTAANLFNNRANKVVYWVDDPDGTATGNPRDRGVAVIASRTNNTASVNTMSLSLESKGVLVSETI